MFERSRREEKDFDFVDETENAGSYICYDWSTWGQDQPDRVEPESTHLFLSDLLAQAQEGDFLNVVYI